MRSPMSQRETMVRPVGPPGVAGPLLRAMPTRAPGTWRRPARPRSWRESSTSWRMAAAPWGEPWQRAAAAGVAGGDAAEGGEAAVDELGGGALGGELECLVGGDLLDRGAVFDLGEVD